VSVEPTEGMTNFIPTNTGIRSSFLRSPTLCLVGIFF